MVFDWIFWIGYFYFVDVLFMRDIGCIIFSSFEVDDFGKEQIIKLFVKVGSVFSSQARLTKI